MRPSDFFVELEDRDWQLKGRDPWDRIDTVLNEELLEKLRQGPLESWSDLEAAYGLTQLAHEELLAFGTDGSERLDNDQMTLALRALRAVLKRVDIALDLPFRDFRGFHGYWSKHDMGGSWAARRGYLGDIFPLILSRLEKLEDRQTASAIRGINGELKNIIFASTGPKPRIVLRDAINNIIEITEHKNHCLFYDRTLSDAGLTWAELTDWWRSHAAPPSGKSDGCGSPAGM